MSLPASNDRFTPEVREVIAAAKISVMQYKHTHITPEHILLGILAGNYSDLQTVLKSGSASVQQITDLVKHHLRPGEEAIPEKLLNFSERAKRVIEAARQEAQRARSEKIGVGHLLLGLTQVSNTVCGAVLRAVEVNTDSVRAALDLTTSN